MFKRILLHPELGGYFEVEVIKARKPHMCDACGNSITPSMPYHKLGAIKTHVSSKICKAMKETTTEVKQYER